MSTRPNIVIESTLERWREDPTLETGGEWETTHRIIYHTDERDYKQNCITANHITNMAMKREHMKDGANYRKMLNTYLKQNN